MLTNLNEHCGHDFSTIIKRAFTLVMVKEVKVSYRNRCLYISQLNIRKISDDKP